MRKLSTFILAFSLFAINAVHAALSGTYTVGGASPAYATPTAAAAALVSQGVSGPVIFDIRPGTYVGKVVLTAVTGASSTNTITFQAENGDSSSVLLNDAVGSSVTDNYVVNIYGADWVTLRKLTISRTGSGTYGTVVAINNISIGTTVENCHLIGPMTNVTSVNATLIYSPTGGTSVDSITTIRNNYLENGSYAIHLAGPNSTFREPQNVIENNIIVGTGNQGIHLQDQRSPIIRNNSISAMPGTIQFAGIYLTNIDRGVQVYTNRISGQSSGTCWGIYVNGVTALAGAEGLIYNNFVACTGSGTSAAIYLTSTTNHKLIYNSVNMYSSPVGALGLQVSGVAGSNISLQNNNIVSCGTAVDIAAGLNTSIVASDYNNLYGAVATGNWDGLSRVNLIDWQTASSFDGHSVSGDPQFASNTDLRSTSAIVNNNALPYAGITTDIDGALRDATNPDMGAAEFTPLGDNIGPVAVVTPTSTSCGTAAVQVAVSIRNFGSNAQSNIPVTAEVTGAVTATLSATYVGPLASGATDTVYFTQTLNTIAGGTLDVTAYTALAGDLDNLNDTTQGSATFLAIPNAPTTNTFNYCPGGIITSTTDSGFATFWFESDTASAPVFIGNTFSPAITASTTYWMESRQEGAGGCLRITEVALDDPSLPSGNVGDFVEVQNLSALPFDATGWKVVACDGSTDINTINTITWDLGVFQAGEIQYRSDNTADNYWGSNLLLNPGSAGWMMIIDQNGIVQDYVAFGWTASDIQSLNITVGGFNVTVGSQWTGDGAIACSGTSVSRTGNVDHDNASDITCSSYSVGAQNPGLSNAFTGCGYGACASARVPAQVSVLAPISVTLGPDTVLVNPFSYTLDAGAGFSSYLWSDGSTGQTLTVTAPGSYFVLVSNASGCTAIDTVLIDVTTGMQSVQTADVTLYPNPASNNITVAGLNGNFGRFTAVVYDLQGREVYREMIEAAATHQFTVQTASWAEGTYTLQMVGENFSCHRPLVISHR